MIRLLSLLVVASPLIAAPAPKPDAVKPDQFTERRIQLLRDSRVQKELGLSAEQRIAVIDHFGRAFGPRLLAFDGEVARRVAEVQLYVRQHGAERDLARLGQLACESVATT